MAHIRSTLPVLCSPQGSLTFRLYATSVVAAAASAVEFLLHWNRPVFVYATTTESMSSTTLPAYAGWARRTASISVSIVQRRYRSVWLSPPHNVDLATHSDNYSRFRTADWIEEKRKKETKNIFIFEFVQYGFRWLRKQNDFIHRGNVQVVREGEYCTLFSTDSKRLHTKLFAKHLALLTNVRALDFFFLH